MAIAQTLTGETGIAPPPTSLLLSTGDVATMLSCSVRHIRRLIDTGYMPKPLKLGSLLRWRKSDIEQWVAEGCPRPRKT